MRGLTNPIVASSVQAALSIVVAIATFLVSALVAFVPLTALPGELQTGFVNPGWVKVAWIVLFGGVMTLRLGPLAQRQDQPWWPSTRRFAWRFMSTFVLLFWCVGGLVWVNAYGVAKLRTHNMRVTGFERVAKSSGGSSIEHYKLAEVGTSWRADLEPTYARDAFLEEGSCVRIVVRQGRLGLDWISDAVPIPCPEA